MARTHSSKRDEWRAEALLCFGASGWDTREQGDVRRSSTPPGQVISPLRHRAVHGKGNRDLPPWAGIFPSYILEHKLPA